MKLRSNPIQRRRRILISAVVAALLWSGFWGLQAQETEESNASAESLIQRPPFRDGSNRREEPVRANVPTQGSINQQYQLSGIFNSGGKTQFSIHKKSGEAHPVWLAIGETEEGLTIVSYDPEMLGVVVSLGGRQEMLKLKETDSEGGRVRRTGAFRPSDADRNATFPQAPPPPPRASKLLEQLRNRNK